jgi:hypothetical protein
VAEAELVKQQIQVCLVWLVAQVVVVEHTMVVLVLFTVAVTVVALELQHFFNQVLVMVHRLRAENFQNQDFLIVLHREILVDTAYLVEEFLICNLLVERE